jgi:tripartite-type tricarboxylate transporter receptor subunit TctC
MHRHTPYRRTHLKTLIIRLSIALAAACPLLAMAQPFPSRPIRIVVPYAPGGITDQLAREVGYKLGEIVQQSVIVDNRPGGLAQPAVSVVKQSPADGYTLFMGDLPSLGLNPSLASKLSYDPRKDLQGVTKLVVSPGFLVVPNESPYKTFDDLLKAARAGKPLTYASQGVGTGGHLFGALFSAKTQSNLTHVPYKGSGPALIDVAGGKVDFMYDTVTSAGPLVQGGTVRVIAVGVDQRLPQFPSAPTLKELGHGDIALNVWWGVAVKAGTPRDVLAVLEKALHSAMHDPAVASKFTSQGVMITTSASPSEFSTFISDEIDRWGKVIRESKMSID